MGEPVHRELISIVRLWQHDCEVDELKEQAAILKEAVAQLDVSIATFAAEVEHLEEQRTQCASQQAEVQRDLDRYIARRDRAKELMKGGHALDFGTVQKQVEQCSEKVDELELEVLQFMEQRDQLTSEIEANAAGQVTARNARAEANETWRTRGGQIRSAMEQVWPARQAASQELTRDQQVRYEDFRKRGLAPVAPITGNTCGACHVVVVSHMRMEVRSGKRLHTCRGCRRWLLSPEDANELDENSSDA